MKKEYDFTDGIKNPYAKKLRKQVTINLVVDVIDYFKKESAKCGIPYQTLINLYLVECMNEKRRLKISWEYRKAHDCELFFYSPQMEMIFSLMRLASAAGSAAPRIALPKMKQETGMPLKRSSSS